MSPLNPDKPGTPIPVAELMRRLIERKPELARDTRASAQQAFPPVLPQYGEVVTGRLVSHGSAIYPLGGNSRPSYFVKILTSHGPETLWGTDLKRAIEESQTQPKLNSIIGAQRVGYQVLKIPQTDAAKSNPAGKSDSTLRRARWRVESVTYFAGKLRDSRKAREAHLKDIEPRRERVRPSPDARLGLAAEFADRYIRNPLDREEFLRRVGTKLGATNLKNESKTKDQDPPTR
jgi:hypothetical protein